MSLHTLANVALGDAGGGFGDFQSAPAAPDTNVQRYVTIDTTTHNDCYGVPSAAAVIHAIRNTIGDDDTKLVKKLFGHNEGLWRVETNRIDLYEKVELLKNGETVVGTVLKVKSEEMVTNSDGKVIAKPVRRKGELLVTLTGANMQFFADVSD